jgi:putative NIF3 family GTP cyclohydrolase 1 type 2
MKAEEVYQQLEEYFITPELSDDWYQYMEPIADFLADNFKECSMGLVCDNTREINKVYTAVFPSAVVTNSIINKNETDVLLFVHHPSIWDIRMKTGAFHLISRDVLRVFRERRISIYNLHVPLDNHSPYSTSVNYARVMNIVEEKVFGWYYGALGGVIGKTKLSSVTELKEKLETVIGHRAGMYLYGGNSIKDGRVAVAAGGGNIISILKEIAEEGINTFVTGISVRNSHTEPSHKFAEDNGISILGGTHYSTEKFACMAMCNYFSRLGLPAEFIKDQPVLEDI